MARKICPVGEIETCVHGGCACWDSENGVCAAVSIVQALTKLVRSAGGV